MITHYLKIAFRNLWKYKSQTLISILGLAIGFTCFALATLWIVYEMSFDGFHKNVKQMFVVYSPSSNSQTGYSRKSTPHPLAAHLKETFPEIVNTAAFSSSNFKGEITVEDVEYPAWFINADSSFLALFDVKILVGNQEFLHPESWKIAITQKKARELFGLDNPIGKTVLRYGTEYTISAVVTEKPDRSIYAFDFILPSNIRESNSISFVHTVIELIPGTDVEAFEKKLFDHETTFKGWYKSEKVKITPIAKVRYVDPEIEREVKFQHIVVFAISGLLVILCSLFNYLTLFASRFRMRQKELALRVVCGASGGSLLAMLTVEFILTLLLSVLFGCIFTLLMHKPFLALSNISMNLPAIYRESLMYIGVVMLVSLLLFRLIIFIFRRSTLNVSIRRSNKKLFRKASIVVQLLISVGFAFCTIVILKQMYFLHHSEEIGFSYKNRGSLQVWGDNEDVLENQLKQIPEITEVVNAKGQANLLPQSGRHSREISSWDDNTTDAANINIEEMFVSANYMAFYEFRLLAGEMLTDADPESMVLLNENAVKAFGWRDPVGKQFSNGKYTVKGVIRHICNFAPTVPAKPVMCTQGRSSTTRRSYGDGKEIPGRIVLFKYHEGMWESCREKIRQMYDRNTIEVIYNAEEEYEKYFKSENALIKLLTVVSSICVLICMFGFVSLVSLSCEERRKEIAIRKINGATTGAILAMFAREYFLLLCIGTTIAFSSGYYVMQRWLEQYVKQTNIPVWVYLSIIFVMALVIVLCVGWQVYKASVKNPAEVVKSE